MPEARSSKLPSHDPKKVPDPSPTCPRCHYWEQKAAAEAAGGETRVMESSWPLGIDQNKSGDLLVKAFPKSYGVKTA